MNGKMKLQNGMQYKSATHNDDIKNLCPAKLIKHRWKIKILLFFVQMKEYSFFYTRNRLKGKTKK